MAYICTIILFFLNLVGVAFIWVCSIVNKVNKANIALVRFHRRDVTVEQEGWCVGLMRKEQYFRRFSVF